VLSTMSDFPLTIGSIFNYGVMVHGASEVVTWAGDRAKRATFREVGARAKQLACALDKLGIRPGDRIGTLCWNTQEHLEAYYAVSSMGAVVHTLNLRLFPQQLAYVINHGEDRILFVDASLLPVLESVAKRLRTVERVIVIGDSAKLPEGYLRYEELVADEQPDYQWPQLAIRKE
jgi:fatty-acyl-CoA synthase